MLAFIVLNFKCHHSKEFLLIIRLFKLFYNFKSGLIKLFNG